MWVKLDDNFPDHPKVVGLSDAALAAWLRGLCYAGRHLTDGLLPEGYVRRIAKPKVRAELFACGLWDAHLEGALVHDYLDWNPSRATVMAQRARTRKRVQEHRDRRLT